MRDATGPDEFVFRIGTAADAAECVSLWVEACASPDGVAVAGVAERARPEFDRAQCWIMVEDPAIGILRQPQPETQCEDIANPDNRAVRGNTFTYLVIALATVVENLRQILSFYKRKLAIDKVTAKNREIPGTFWQSTDPAAPTGEGP
jgi:hypothetical protein